MKIKEGVRITGLQPQMVLASLIVDRVYNESGQEAVITSAVDGKHSKTSRHYLGYALDFRTRYFDPVHVPEIVRQLKDALGDDYYVAFESDHIHISFKPEFLTK